MLGHAQLCFLFIYDVDMIFKCKPFWINFFKTTLIEFLFEILYERVNGSCHQVCLMEVPEATYDVTCKRSDNFTWPH